MFGTSRGAPLDSIPLRPRGPRSEGSFQQAVHVLDRDHGIEFTSVLFARVHWARPTLCIPERAVHCDGIGTSPHLPGGVTHDLEAVPTRFGKGIVTRHSRLSHWPAALGHDRTARRASSRWFSSAAATSTHFGSASSGLTLRSRTPTSCPDEEDQAHASKEDGGDVLGSEIETDPVRSMERSRHESVQQRSDSHLTRYRHLDSNVSVDLVAAAAPLVGDGDNSRSD